MSEHLHSHAEPHSCSLSERSLQFELQIHRSLFPLSLSIYPQPPCACPSTKSLLQPTPFCGRLSNVHPLSFPFSSLCPTLLPSFAHDNSFIPRSAHFWQRSKLQPNSKRCLWIVGCFFCFQIWSIYWCVSLFLVILGRSHDFNYYSLPNVIPRNVNVDMGNILSKKTIGKHGFGVRMLLQQVN